LVDFANQIKLQEYSQLGVIMVDRLIAIASALAAVIIIPVTVFLYRRGQEEKHLDYEFISGTHVIKEEIARAKADLQLYSDGRIVKDPYLLIMRIINTGNRPIQESDFTDRIRIDFQAGVVTAKLIKSSPVGIATELEWEGGVLYVHGMLLNQGDWVALSILTDGEPRRIPPEARIVGVRELREFSPEPRPPSTRRKLLITLLALIAGIISGSINNGMLGRILNEVIGFHITIAFHPFRISIVS
jgi:hypothetical protein